MFWIWGNMMYNKNEFHLVHQIHEDKIIHKRDVGEAKKYDNQWQWKE